MKYFVKDGGMLSKIKNKRLSSLMKQGSKFSTPLERKGLFEPLIDNGEIICVYYYCPNLGHTVISETFGLTGYNTISREDWLSIMAPADQYPEFRKAKDSREALRNMISEFEQLAKAHGINQQNIVAERVSDQAHVRASGHALKIARENIFKELGIQ